MRKLSLVIVLVFAIAGVAASSAEEGSGKESAGKTCGTIAGIPCPDGLWCDLEAGRCGTTDLKGACVEIGDFCPEVEAPVCGCDGKKYGNDCKRIRAKAQKNHEGACKSS